jgi:hypothetical protein
VVASGSIGFPQAALPNLRIIANAHFQAVRFWKRALA